MSAAERVPQLRLVVNADTGELVEQDERDLLIDELTRDLHGTKTQLGKLRKELSTLRGLEPEAQEIREVLEYWRERCKPQAGIAPDGTRWQKTRARLREKLTDRPPVTPAELRLAVDGALLDHWHTQKGMGHRLDADFLFRSYESVERLRDLASPAPAAGGFSYSLLLLDSTDRTLPRHALVHLSG